MTSGPGGANHRGAGGIVRRGRRVLPGGVSARMRALTVGGAVCALSLATLAAVPRLDAEAQTSPSKAVAAATPLVIGAVGDMACDPSDPHFNHGEGTPNACARIYRPPVCSARPPRRRFTGNDAGRRHRSVARWPAWVARGNRLPVE